MARRGVDTRSGALRRAETVLTDLTKAQAAVQAVTDHFPNHLNLTDKQLEQLRQAHRVLSSVAKSAGKETDRLKEAERLATV